VSNQTVRREEDAGAGRRRAVHSDVCSRERKHGVRQTRARRKSGAPNVIGAYTPQHTVAGKLASGLGHGPHSGGVARHGIHEVRRGCGGRATPSTEPPSQPASDCLVPLRSLGRRGSVGQGRLGAVSCYRGASTKGFRVSRQRRPQVRGFHATSDWLVSASQLLVIIQRSMRLEYKAVFRSRFVRVWASHNLSIS
jgi:hypothetical protein